MEVDYTIEMGAPEKIGKDAQEKGWGISVEVLMMRALSLSEYVGLVFPVRSLRVVSLEERGMIAMIRVKMCLSVLPDEKREITVDINSAMNKGEIGQFSLNIMANIAKELVVSKMEAEMPEEEE